jgi:hypothetical protein
MFSNFLWKRFEELKDYLYDNQTGKGKEIYTNGIVYEGDFVCDEYKGKGKLTFPDGDIYDGDFLNDRCTGKGNKYFSNWKMFMKEKLFMMRSSQEVLLSSKECPLLKDLFD